MQPHEIFASQHYATSVYCAELVRRLQGLDYDLERGKHGQPEIKGYTKEYLEASSPSCEQINRPLIAVCPRGQLPVSREAMAGFAFPLTCGASIVPFASWR